MTSPAPRVSVVVPTYRRNDLLRRCLAALAAQDFDPADYEVIVVDDAASAETRRLVEGWAQGDRIGGERGLAFEDRPKDGKPSSSAPAIARSASNAAAAGPTANATAVAVAALAQPLTVPWMEREKPAAPDLDGPGDVTIETHYGTRAAPVPGAIPGEKGWQVAPELPFDAPLDSPTFEVSETSKVLNVRYLPVTGPAHGPAVARNLGWRAAAGEIIAFTDDDCLPTPGWLRAGVAAFVGSEAVVGVSGRVIVPLAGVPTDYELNATGLERSEFVTANCFYRRQALDSVGGFDKRFAIAWREDTDLLFTLLSQQGERGSAEHGQDVGSSGGLRHVPEALVIHPIRPAPAGVSLRQQRKNLYNALLYKKHPVLYRSRLGATTPWRYYAILAALLVVPVSLAMNQKPTAVSAALLWFALTVQFCARRLAGTSHAPKHVAEMAYTSALIPPLAIFWRLVGAVKYRVWFL